MNIVLEKSFVEASQKIAFGFSKSSLALLSRLKESNQVDQIFISDQSGLSLEKNNSGLTQLKPKEFLNNHWKGNNKIIFIGSIGAVVRLIAPFIKSKKFDPAIVVMDAKAKNVICILGGHMKGGDQFAKELSADFSANAIFTADSITEERIPLDSFGEGWGWMRGGEITEWRKLMINQSRNNKNIVFQSSGSKLWQELKACSNYSFMGNNKLISSENIDLLIGKEEKKVCSWHPPTIIIGIGCERNTDEGIIQRAIEESFSRNGLSILAVACVTTIDKKNNEIGLINLVKRHKWPIHFFNSQELSKVNVPTPSNVVMNQMGTPSVAEASAILFGGEDGKLIQRKQIYYPNENELGAVTIALVESKNTFAPQKGELHLVGSGPGELKMLTSDSLRALTRCVAWVGYAPYLDYLEPIRGHDQVRVESELTFEKDRCKKALSLAKGGAKVALISSGDSGIYGMAGLALEFWLAESIKSRPLLQFHPGISAIQMAAAKLGAPLMHDFCSISLSDLLTPWEKIEQRIKSAAKGDFVIAIFNPKSAKRYWQLKKTVDLLLEFHRPTTPVGLARQLGREEESIEIYNLESLPLDKVDMLSILIIGNSQSIVKDNKFLTPRGYFNN